MLLVRVAVAACVLLALTACGVGHSSQDAEPTLRTDEPTAAAQQSEDRNPDEISKSLGDGVTLVVVSTPKSFTPTDTAYPRAARAVAFDMVIENDSDTVYRPAQLSFEATANDAEAAQVIDSTQGYTGVVGAIDEVLPNQSLRFAIAFGVPEQPCVVRLTVRPNTASNNTIPIFDGTI